MFFLLFDMWRAVTAGSPMHVYKEPELRQAITGWPSRQQALRMVAKMLGIVGDVSSCRVVET